MPLNKNLAAPVHPPVRHGTRGLLIDLETALSRPTTLPSSSRRRALHWLTAAGTALATAACGDGSSDSTSDTSGTGSETGDSSSGGSIGETPSDSSGSTTVGACVETPTTTEGPYPADGTQMTGGGPGGGGPGGAPGGNTGTTSGSAVNALTISGIVRSDIRTSISGSGATAEGVPVTLKLKLVDSSNSCATMANRAIYIWHCDRDGNYSLYSSGVTDLDYLRGVQVTDANGEVTFTTIFPACYTGRWPHIHFEVYSTLTEALDSSAVGDYSKVSQFALPETVCDEVYDNVAGYTNSVRNLAQLTLATDNVFGADQAVNQMATVTGSNGAGYVVSMTIGVTG